MFRTLAVLGLISLTFAPPGDAQEGAPRLDPGQRVRVHQGKRTVVGTLLAADSAEILLLTSSTDTVRLRRADISSVDVSIGQKSGTISGALKGAALGAVGAGVATYIAEKDNESAGAFVAAGAVAGFVFGAVVGAVVGAGSHTDRWQPTVWPTLDMGRSETGGKAVALGVHFTF